MRLALTTRSIGLSIGLLLAAFASAQETDRAKTDRKTDAPRKPIPIRFDAGAVDVMPGLSNPQRYRLKRWLNTDFKRFIAMERRLQKINDTLKRERDKNKRATLVADRKKLTAQRDKLRKTGRAKFDKLGIKPDQLDRLNTIPRGEVRRERYNHSVMLEAPGLTETQVGLIRACIAATDSAQLTLALQRRDVKRTLADQEPKVRQRVMGDINNRIRATEKRFWIAMLYLLTPEQMRATRPLRSPNYQRIGDQRNHLYMLPGLSTIQASRINSLLNESQSETAADDAVIRTLQRKLRGKGLDGAERKEFQAQLRDAYARRGRIYSENNSAVRELMTDEQSTAWASIPPQISGSDMSRNLMQNFSGLALTSEQMAALRKLNGAAQKRIQQKQRALRDSTKALRESGMGADSPQMMMMNSMQRGVQGDRARILRTLGHEFCTTVFESGQLATWLATGSARP